MAQKINILLSDDLDGSTAHESVAFSLDGLSYELDLSTENAATMRNELRPYVAAARRVSRPSRNVPGRTANPTFDEVDPKAVRAWAASNNVELSARGRIPAAVLEGFRAAGH